MWTTPVLLRISYLTNSQLAAFPEGLESLRGVRWIRCGALAICASKKSRLECVMSFSQLCDLTLCHLPACKSLHLPHNLSTGPGKPPDWDDLQAPRSFTWTHWVWSFEGKKTQENLAVREVNHYKSGYENGIGSKAVLTLCLKVWKRMDEEFTSFMGS